MPIFTFTGALGFEPRDGGTKTRCLTTWLRPNELTLVNIAVIPGLMSSTLIVYFQIMVFYSRILISRNAVLTLCKQAKAQSLTRVMPLCLCI